MLHTRLATHQSLFYCLALFGQARYNWHACRERSSVQQPVECSWTVDTIHQKSMKIKWALSETEGWLWWWLWLSWGEWFWRVGIWCWDSLASHTRGNSKRRGENRACFNIRKQQHNIGVHVHSSSNPRVRAPWVLGRGHWVGSEFHRDMVSAGFIQELRSFVVTGVTWWPCYLKITWRFKNIAGEPFFNSTQLSHYRRRKMRRKMRTNVNFIIQIWFLAGHGCDVYWPASVSCHIKVQFANSTKQRD